MVHLVYTDNTGKAGERELDQINQGTKTMIVRGGQADERYPTAECLKEKCCTLWRKERRRFLQKQLLNR